jgi:hypothetical protein
VSKKRPVSFSRKGSDYVNFRSLFLIFLVLVVLSAGTSSAYVRYQPADNQIRIYVEAETANMSRIDAALEVQNDATYGGPYPNVVTYDEATGFWIINAYINMLGDTTLDLTDTKLKINNTYSQAGIATAGNNRVTLDNTTILSVTDSTGNTLNTNGASQESVLLYNPPVFRNVNISYLDHTYVYQVYNLTMSNITSIGCDSPALLVHTGDNITIENGYFEDAVGTHLWIEDVTNFDVSNIQSYNAGDYTSPATGRYNILVQGACNDFVITDCILNGSGWSSLNFALYGTDYPYNGTISNITIENSGHNGIDVHRAANLSFNDIWVNNSDSNNYVVTSGVVEQATNNIKITNSSSYNAGAGVGFLITYVSDCLFVNNYDDGNSGSSFSTLWALDTQFINCTGDSGIGLSRTENSPYPWSNNVSVINCGDTEIRNTYASDTKIVNSNASNIVLTNGNYTLAYPINIKVENSTGYAIDNAQIDITTTGLSLNGYGSSTTTAYTDSTGKLNESQLIYVADFLRDSSTGYTYYTVDVQASKDGSTDSELAINPDSSWYSPDLDNLNGTLVTLTLDVEGSGEPMLAISDFTPTDTTPSLTLGESLNFTVTTSKAANITWYSNGVQKVFTENKTTSYYDKTPSAAGEYNVTVIATDGVDTVSQTWIWTVSEDHDNEYVAVVFAGLSFVGLYFANRFRRR